MPFYEFFCEKCRKRETFHAKRPTSSIPPCPHCGGVLSREIPNFTISASPDANEDADWLGAAGLDGSRAASAASSMNSLLDAAMGKNGIGGEIAVGGAGNGASADTTRNAARTLRRYAAAAGISLGKEARELVNSVESGIDVENTAADFQNFLDSGGKPFSDAQSSNDFGEKRASSEKSDENDEDKELHEMPEELLPPLPKRKPGPWDDPF